MFMLLLLLNVLGSNFAIVHEFFVRTRNAHHDHLYLALLDKEQPAKGTPWPRIMGPRADDKVCIVGAGPAGLHMAVELRDRKYSNITILEKSNRVGGKCYDVDYRGLPHPQGAVYLGEEYFDNLVPLARRYGAANLVKLGPSFAILRGGRKLSQFEYLGYGPMSYIIIFFDAIKYVKLHRELFGRYNGELMPRPSPAVLYRIRGTFEEFLRRENLLSLRQIFKLTFTVQGYGYHDEIAALYGLMWNTPRLLAIIVAYDHPQYALFAFKDGHQHVWNSVQARESFNIKYNTIIDQVRRFSSHVEIQSNHGVEECDWMIWTPEIHDLVESLEKPSVDEERLLTGQSLYSFASNIINVRNHRGGPFTTYDDNIEQKKQNSVAIDGEWMGLLRKVDQTEAGIERYIQESSSVTRTLISYQFSRAGCTSDECNRIVSRHYNNLTGFQPHIVHTTLWPRYFPHWSPGQVIC